MNDAFAQADDLLAFIDASPTPYHVVRETARRLELAGFRHLDEGDAWKLDRGEKVYVVRSDSSIAAFELGSAAPEEAGFHLVGAHTDSPTLRVKPQPAGTKVGFSQLGVEVYGGVLLSTWLDRDLSLAGRVVVREKNGSLGRHLIDFKIPMARVPNLAIHLNREVNTAGLILNPQTHMVPVIGLADSAENVPALLAAEVARVTRSPARPEDVLGWDLSFYTTERSARGGSQGEFLFAPRLDNLASSHAALCALTSSGGSRPRTRGFVLYDHEECGSRSAQGAGSSMLRSCLERIVGNPGSSFARAISRSFLISADMAHAGHPNYSDKHEPMHMPLLGKGPVIKSNSNQSYATDGESLAFFESVCQSAKVKTQRFVTRTDLACGSTIGPITAASLGIKTVDVGNPMLSMHSAREMAASSDVAPMIDALAAFYSC